MILKRALLSEVLEEFNCELGDAEEPTILTLTEGNGFVDQAIRFKKRLAILDTSKYKLIKRGDIAFNPYLLWAGAVAHNDKWDSGLLSPLYPTFRAREGFDSRYVWHMLRSPSALSRFDAISFGSVPRKRRAATSDFLSVEIPVGPLPEQRRIAAILDRADELRAKRRRALAFLNELADAIFVEMFGDLGETSARKVSELLHSKKGAIRTGPFGSDLLHSEFVDSGVSVLGIDNVVSNEFFWAKPRFITKEKYAQLRRYTVSPGDVLITIMGTVGRCAVVPNEIGVAINTKHLCCITLDTSKCLPRYLQHYFLKHPRARRYLASVSKGAIMDGLNMELIREMPILVPPLETQRNFTERNNEIDRLRKDQQAHLAGLDELFASLQYRAFAGQL